MKFLATPLKHFGLLVDVNTASYDGYWARREL